MERRRAGGAAGMSYAVKEIFLTLQGEGGRAGRAAVFCRFAGCNLWRGREQDRASAVGSFCDTDFVGMDGGVNGGRFDHAPSPGSGRLPSQWTGPDEAKLVVCTGGEPLLQLDAPLIEAFHAAGFTIAVETNGTLRRPHRHRLDLRQPQGRCRPGPDLGAGTEAGLSAGRRRSGPVREPRFRAFLPAADGQPRPGRQHPGGGRLLPFPPPLAFKRANPQISGPALTGRARFFQSS